VEKSKTEGRKRGREKAGRFYLVKNERGKKKSTEKWEKKGGTLQLGGLKPPGKMGAKTEEKLVRKTHRKKTTNCSKKS